jgi:hypothetical protein
MKHVQTDDHVRYTSALLWDQRGDIALLVKFESVQACRPAYVGAMSGTMAKSGGFWADVITASY